MNDENSINADSLRRYSETFFGYGNSNASFWLLGIEEAGGRCPEVIGRRLELWRDRFSSAAIVDGYEFHQQLTD